MCVIENQRAGKLTTMTGPVHLKLLVLIYITMDQTYLAGGEGYCFLPDKVLVVEANAACSSKGMKLAQPKTLENLNRLDEVLTKKNEDAQGWVDLNYIGHWVWGDGTNFSTANGILWGDGEPRRVDKGEHCAKFRYARLHTANCSIPKKSICESLHDVNSRDFLMSEEKTNEVPAANVTAINIHESGSGLFCLTKCLQNSKCASYAITNNATCFLYETVVTSDFVSQNGSAYYVKPCIG